MLGGLEGTWELLEVSIHLSCLCKEPISIAEPLIKGLMRTPNMHTNHTNRQSFLPRNVRKNGGNIPSTAAEVYVEKSQGYD
jgi:hypothetical protein